MKLVLMDLGPEPVGFGFFLNRNQHQFVAHVVGMQDIKETHTEQFVMVCEGQTVQSHWRLQRSQKMR